jgi:ABC-type multidrug transport system fused ATPase/permease subunit
MKIWRTSIEVVRDPRARNSGWQFLFLIAVLTPLFYVIVWKQWALVASPAVFCLLIVVLILVAFFASAIEAAFTVVTSSPAYKEIFEEITEKQNQLAANLEPIDMKESLSLSSDEEKTRSKILSKSKRLGIKRRALNGEMRDEFVGALSAFSVFLNTGLAAFLPFTVVNSFASPLINVPYPLVTVGNDGVLFSVSNYGFVAPKLLIFFASAIPVLILGKIIPKMVGFRYPRMAYKFYWFGRGIHFALGWIAIGAKWPLLLQIKKV